MCLDNKASLRQLVRQGIFVIVLRKSGAKRFGDRVRAYSLTLRYFLETLVIGVNRRLSTV